MSKRRRHSNVVLPPKKPVLDMHHMAESDRCNTIARMAAERKIVAFMVDDEVTDGEHKADRYMRQIRAADPRLVELDRTPGPVPNVITVRVALPEMEN